MSALAGIAIDRGALPGADMPVLPKMDYASYANPDPRKAQITLSNFLSMSSGLNCNDHSADSPRRETVIDDQPDWVKATLDLPMINDPGAKGYYCSGGVSVVGRLTENAARMKLPDFAQAHLFTQLGIPRSNWQWNCDLTNADKEYSQIHLRPATCSSSASCSPTAESGMAAGSSRAPGSKPLPPNTATSTT